MYNKVMLMQILELTLSHKVELIKHKTVIVLAPWSLELA